MAKKVRALTLNDLKASATPEKEAELLDEMLEKFADYLPAEGAHRIKELANEARAEARRSK